jgi:flagellar basal body-associated protein FliL
MADEAASETTASPPKKGIKGLLLAGVVGLASAAAGFAVPQLLGGGAHNPAESDPHEATPSKKESAHAGVAYVPFGEVVANLDDNRMMRYVRAKFSLSVDKKDWEAVQHIVEENKTVLKNWLIGYLQNKQIEEVRGTEGFNRIRREIQDRFNEMLFPDSEGKIREVLFDEFNIQ